MQCLGYSCLPSTTATASEDWFELGLRALLNNSVAFCSSCAVDDYCIQSHEARIQLLPGSEGFKWRFLR